jgi:hypothetical protein
VKTSDAFMCRWDGWMSRGINAKKRQTNDSAKRSTQANGQANGQAQQDEGQEFLDDGEDFILIGGGRKNSDPNPMTVGRSLAAVFTP